MWLMDEDAFPTNADEDEGTKSRRDSQTKRTVDCSTEPMGYMAGILQQNDRTIQSGHPGVSIPQHVHHNQPHTAGAPYQPSSHRPVEYNDHTVNPLPYSPNLTNEIHSGSVTHTQGPSGQRTQFYLPGSPTHTELENRGLNNHIPFGSPTKIYPALPTHHTGHFQHSPSSPAMLPSETHASAPPFEMPVSRSYGSNINSANRPDIFCHPFDQPSENYTEAAHSVGVQIPSRPSMRKILASVEVSPESPDSYKELFLKCNKHDLPEQKAIGEQSLLSELNKENVLRTFQIANLYDVSRLFHASFDLIVQHATDLLQPTNTDVLDLCKYDLQKLFMDDRIRESNVDIFALLEAWYHHESDARHADYVTLNDFLRDSRKRLLRKTRSNTSVDSLGFAGLDGALEQTEDTLVTSPIRYVMKNRRYTTYLGHLSTLGGDSHFSIIMPENLGFNHDIDTPQLDNGDQIYSFGIAEFCRTEYVFVAFSSGKVMAFNVLKSKWITYAPLQDLDSYGFVAVDSSVFAIGGRKNSEITNSVLKLNMKKKSPKWKPKGILREALYGSACVAYDTFFYVIGGVNEAGRMSRSIQIFDPNVKKSEIVTNLPKPITNGHAIVCRENIYIASQGKELFEFNPKKNICTTFTKLQVPCESFSIAADPKLIYVTEAGVGEVNPRIFVFNPSTNDWACCGRMAAHGRIVCTMTFPYPPG